jgi:hypothetical protein
MLTCGSKSPSANARALLPHGLPGGHLSQSANVRHAGPTGDTDGYDPSEAPAEAHRVALRRTGRLRKERVMVSNAGFLPANFVDHDPLHGADLEVVGAVNRGAFNLIAANQRTGLAC